MTNHLLDSFQQKRDALIKAYQTLPQLDQNFFELGIIKSQQLADWQHKLQQAHFTLCIAGQMNAGKSTLINALVFGRNVLPVYDTVMTSTITQIKHISEHPKQQEGATVEFYSNSEWQALKQALETNQTFKQNFDEIVNQAELKGARAAELIGSPLRTLTGFANLNQYIAPLEKNKDGIYTPLVKQITIYADSPLLKDLTVVDTPGTNDPNEIRANLTETWIKNADAVLYVTYAGQALSKPDIDFINRFMIHVANTHRIIAISKIDCIDNLYQLDQWLLTLQNNRDSEAIKQIFSAQTPIVKVCALASLLESLPQPLDDDSQWYKDDLFEKGYIGTGKHNMDALKQTINDRILANKANSIITSHQRHIEGVFYELLNILNQQKSTHQQTLLDTTYTKEQLEKTRSELQGKQDALKVCLSNFKTLVEEKITDFTANLKNEQSELVKKLTLNLTSKLKDLDSYKKLEADAAWHVKLIFEELICKNLAETVKSEMGKFKEFIDTQTLHLHQKLKSLDILINSKLELTLEHAVYLNLRLFDIDAHTLTLEQVQDVISNNTWFAQPWFNWGLDDVKAKIIAEARQRITPLIIEITRDIVDKTDNSVDKITNEVENSIKTEVQKRQDMLQNLLNEDESLKNRRSEIHQAIKQIEQDILAVQQVKQITDGYLV